MERHLRRWRPHVRIVSGCAISSLPRLGSWVRIPSPAPKFFTIDIELRATLRSARCFPTSPVEAGEAWGKRRKANAALRPRTIGGVAMRRCTEPLSSCVRSTTTGLKLSHRIERPVHLFSQGPPTHRHKLTTPALPSNDSFNDLAHRPSPARQPANASGGLTGRGQEGLLQSVFADGPSPALSTHVSMGVRR
jgi:hypothetical protein